MKKLGICTVIGVLLVPITSMAFSLDDYLASLEAQGNYRRLSQRTKGVLLQPQSRNFYEQHKKAQQRGQAAQKRSVFPLWVSVTSRSASANKYIATLEAQGRYRRLSQRTKRILQARDRKLFEEKKAHQ